MQQENEVTKGVKWGFGFALGLCMALDLYEIFNAVLDELDRPLYDDIITGLPMGVKENNAAR